jgi:Tfp pilus assembly protein PilN
MEAGILAFIQKADIATTVLVLMLAGMGYLHVIWRKEEREDRAKLLELIGKNTDALNSIKNVLSAVTGKAV